MCVEGETHIMGVDYLKNLIKKYIWNYPNEVYIHWHRCIVTEFQLR